MVAVGKAIQPCCKLIITFSAQKRQNQPNFRLFMIFFAFVVIYLDLLFHGCCKAFPPQRAAKSW